MTYYSQIGQDRWVESVLNNKRDGYFVELGACDGLHLSNTLHFERDMSWNGICIEPADTFYTDLIINRKCNTSNSLISSYDGDVVDFSYCGAVSGILNEHTGSFTSSDNVVKKTTTTLASVLEQFNAPEIIDYLSLDVEGQEYNILKTFPFDKYKFRCITVEHNAPHVGDTLQMKIRDILIRNGYTFVKGNDDVHQWGHGPIDDFYVCATI